MAEVSITGQVDKAYNVVSNTTALGVKTSHQLITANAYGQDQLVFAASEDIGDGMSAYANIRFLPDISSPGSAFNNDVSQVGLRGAFGDVRLGSDYGTTWYAINAADATNFGNGSGNVHSVGAGGAVSDLIIYTFPTFVPGLGVTIGKRANNFTSGRGDAKAYLVSYTTGGLTLMAAGGSVRTDTWTTQSGIGTVGAAQQGSAAAPGGAGLGNTAATEINANLSTARATAYTATYDFGMAKIFLGVAEAKSGLDPNQKANSYTYGVKVPFAGAWTASLAGSQASYTAVTTGANVTTKENGYRFLLQYAMSKRTALYYQNGRADISASSASTSSNGIGLFHSF